MSTITIIGAGQSGLQLGIGLLDNGYDVTTVSYTHLTLPTNREV